MVRPLHCYFLGITSPYVTASCFLYLSVDATGSGTIRILVARLSNYDICYNYYFFSKANGIWCQISTYPGHSLAWSFSIRLREVSSSSTVSPTSDSWRWNVTIKNIFFFHCIKSFLFPLKSLGVLPDKRKVEGMLLRCYLEHEVPRWRLDFMTCASFITIHCRLLNYSTMSRVELQLLLDRGLKFEIEALSVHSLSFLSDEYLPSKIQNGAYI